MAGQMQALALAAAGVLLAMGVAQSQGPSGGPCVAAIAGLELPLRVNLLHLATLALLVYSLLPCKRHVYVLDFSVFSPPASWRCPRSALRPLAESSGKVLPEHIDFMEKIAFRTGLGDDTAITPHLHTGDMSSIGIAACREEFEATCYPCIEEVLAKTGTKAAEVDFVITNSSLFNPTPSLSAMVMNTFKMGKRCQGYSLGGQGCSAGMIAINLAKDLLELHRNSVALVVSHENISNAFYLGKDPSMLLPNVLFRVNGAAVLLSNMPRHAGRAKYLIRHILRTNLAADDTAYNCVMQLQDEEGNLGVRLNKDIVQVGTRALKDNMTALGPLVLPLSEQLVFASNLVTRQLAKSVPALKRTLPAPLTRPYVPDFKKAFDHFCIHTGGRGIIDGLEKELKLARGQVEPSRASLYRFGNTSSTSVWYELAYAESRQGVRKGARVWQLAFGSGFKFNSSVMQALRTVNESHKAWEGFDAAAMWVELDALEASARAARAAKAAKQAAEAAAAATAAAAAASGKPESAVAAEAAAEVQAAADEPSAFLQPGSLPPDVGADADDVAAGKLDQAPRSGAALSGRPSLRHSRSVRMARLPRSSSLMAVGSGAVPAADIHHLEDATHAEVPLAQ